MATFEIIIQRKKDTGWPVIAMETRAGEFLPVRSESQLQFDLKDLNSCSMPKTYGQFLGNALFAGTLRNGFIRALDHARNSGDPLRMLLTIEDPELKPVHWERLCAPFDDPLQLDFISLHQLTPFSIYLPSLTERRFPAIGSRDLRALVLVAGPEDVAWDNPEYKKDLAAFDIKKTANAVRDSLGSHIPCDILANKEQFPDAVGAPNLKTMCERITSEHYTLLHIVCHGQYNSKMGETRLILPGDDGRPVTGTTLIEQLARLESPHGLPHFTFLMACESAAPEAENGLGGLGQRLVRELGMPAVLAMTEPVSIETANQLAGLFYKRLATTGEPDRALSESLAGLMGSSSVTVPAVFSRLGGRALFSDALTRDLTPDEISDGLKRLAELSKDRAPTQLKKITDLTERLKGVLDPTGRSEADLKVRKDCLEEANAFSEQILDLNFPALAMGRKISDYQAVCPFPGLTSFKPQDKAFFFGREVLVDKLVTRVTAHNFLAVLGASGSGKSSAVLAGLVPALGGQYITITPGAEPVERLNQALAQPDLPPTSPLVVDQFEEAFTLCRDDNIRQAFFKALLVQKEVRKVVITMRADFLGECAPYPELRDEIQKNTELVAPMDAVELRRAIEQQAAAGGLRFEADLAEDILEDVRAEPGAMPLMQHALLLLWQRRRGKWLLLSEYRDFGTVKGAITHTAGEIYNNLNTAAEKEQMRWIFLRLTRLDDSASASDSADAPAEHRDTRRRVTLDELVPAGGSRADIQGLVKQLADARLVITGANPVTHKDEVEVAHEALIRYWPLLRTWLDENRAALRVAETVRGAAQDWFNEKRDENLLNHRGGRLLEALKLEKEGKYRFNQMELDYLTSCQEQAEKARRAAEVLRRALAIAAAVVAVVMTGLGIWGLSSAREATKQANNAATQVVIAQNESGRAERAAATATIAEGEAKVQAAAAQTAQANAEAQSTFSLARALSAESGDLLRDRPDLIQIAVLLAVKGYQLNPDVKTSQALSEALDLLPQPVSTIHMPDAPNMDFSPNGALLATSTENGPVMIWNTATGQLADQFKVDGKVSQVRFLPDNQRVVTLLDDKIVEVWYPPSGQSLSRIDFGSPVEDFQFTPDGMGIIAGTDDGTVTIWSALNGVEVSHRNYPDNKVMLVGFSPYDTTAVVATSSGQVDIWNYKTGVILATSMIPTSDGKPRTYEGLSFVDQSVHILVKVADNQLKTWDVTKNAEVLNIPLGADLTSVAIVPNGVLATGDVDGWVRLMDSSTGRQMKQMRHNDLALEHIGPDGDFSASMDINRQVFSTDGSYLATFAADSTVRVWSTDTGTEVSRVFNFSKLPVAINTDARLVAVSNFQEKTIHIYHMVNGKEQMRTKNAGIIGNPTFSKDRSLAVAPSRGNTVAAWDVATGRELGRVQHQAEVVAAAISPDGERAVSLDAQGNLQVWQIQTGKVLAAMSGAGTTPTDGLFLASINSVNLSAVTFSADGARVVSGTQDGLFIAWDASSGTELVRQAFPPSADHYVFALNPDGRTIAAQLNTKGSPLVLWDLLQKKEIKNIPSAQIDIMTFSPDGRHLVTGNEEHKVQGWDTATGNQQFEMDHDSKVKFIEISADNQSVAVGGSDSTNGRFVRFLELQTGKDQGKVTVQGVYSKLALTPDWQYIMVPELPNQTGPITAKYIYDRAGNLVTTQYAELSLSAYPTFSGDGKQFIYIGEGGEMVSQAWQPEDMVGLACSRLEHNLTKEDWQAIFGDQVPYAPICPGLP